MAATDIKTKVAAATTNTFGTVKDPATKSDLDAVSAEIAAMKHIQFKYDLDSPSVDNLACNYEASEVYQMILNDEYVNAMVFLENVSEYNGSLVLMLDYIERRGEEPSASMYIMHFSGNYKAPGKSSSSVSDILRAFMFTVNVGPTAFTACNYTNPNVIKVSTPLNYVDGALSVNRITKNVDHSYSGWGVVSLGRGFSANSSGVEIPGANDPIDCLFKSNSGHYDLYRDTGSTEQPVTVDNVKEWTWFGQRLNFTVDGVKVYGEIIEELTSGIRVRCIEVRSSGVECYDMVYTSNAGYWTKTSNGLSTCPKTFTEEGHVGGIVTVGPFHIGVSFYSTDSSKTKPSNFTLYGEYCDSWIRVMGVTVPMDTSTGNLTEKIADVIIGILHDSSSQIYVDDNETQYLGIVSSLSKPIGAGVQPSFSISSTTSAGVTTDYGRIDIPAFTATFNPTTVHLVNAPIFNVKL